MLNILEIIQNKKNKIELTYEEIDFVIKGYVFEKNILDYQMSALLMAFRLNGMSDNEIFYFTKSFIENSEKFEFSKNKISIDKHSSGGVGDKVTIIIQPILMALGFAVTKISGRGLGHTGGTIDKLDSIGFNSNLTFNEANEIFKQNNSVLLQQTEGLLPADKMIYALRDVTSTVDTTGLIISSILSKKFVINSDYIFIDLKVGSGAIFDSYKKAKILAKKMLKIATMFNRKLFIHLTNMDQPLGNAIGNAIEIKEACDFLLQKNSNQQLSSIIKEFVVDILLETKKCNNKKEAITLYNDVLENKKAYNEMIKWFKTQDVNVKSIIDNSFFNPKFKCEVYAEDEGFIRFSSAAKVGMVAVKLGAGRIKKNDKLDFQAGIYLNDINSHMFKKGELIATLYSSNPIDNSVVNEFKSIIIYDKRVNKNDKMIICTLNN